MRGRDVKTTAPPNGACTGQHFSDKECKTSVPLSATLAAESAPALATKKLDAGLSLGPAEEL